MLRDKCPAEVSSLLLGKPAMPSSLSWHPVWALPYFSPSCQGTTGSLANLDSSIDVAFVLPGVAIAEEGLSPALFPGNPGL